MSETTIFVPTGKRGRGRKAAQPASRLRKILNKRKAPKEKSGNGDAEASDDSAASSVTRLLEKYEPGSAERLAAEAARQATAGAPDRLPLQEALKLPEVKRLVESDDELAQRLMQKPFQALVDEMIEELATQEPELLQNRELLAELMETKAPASIRARLLELESSRKTSIVEKAVAETHLSVDLMKWLALRPGSVHAAMLADVVREMPSALPAQQRDEATRRLAERSDSRCSAYEFYVRDGRILDLLLEAFQGESSVTGERDVEAGRLYRKLRTQLIRDECVAQPAECKRRLDDLDMQLSMIEKRVVAVPEFRAPMPLERRGAGIRSAEEFVRELRQGADITMTTEELTQTHTESLLATLVNSINLTAQVVCVAPPEALFGTTPDKLTKHPIERMLEVLRKGNGGEPNLTAENVLAYLNIWTQSAKLSQDDIDARLFERDSEESLALVRTNMVKELGLRPIDVEASLSYSSARPSPVLVSLRTASDDAKLLQAQMLGEQSTQLRRRHAEELDRAKRQCRRNEQSGADASLNETIGKTRIAKEARLLQKYMRAFLRQFLRAPLAHRFERACSNGNNCITMQINGTYPLDLPGCGMPAPLKGIASGDATSTTARSSQRGFVMREFRVTPLTSAEEVSKSPLLFCLLCNRRETTWQYHFQHRPRTSSAAATKRQTPLTVLQDHAVIVNQEGEYNSGVCLGISDSDAEFNGIVLPSISFSMSHYSISTTVVDGHCVPCVVESSAMDFH